MFEDSDERAIFFAKGVIETVKKLGWKPDIIHCHGWMASLLPVYLKQQYAEDPHFADSKLVVSLYKDGFDGKISEDLNKKLAFDEISEEDTKMVNEATYNNMLKLAMKNSDGVVKIGDEFDADLIQSMEDSDVSVLDNPENEDAAAYSSFYDALLEETVTTS